MSRFGEGCASDLASLCLRGMGHIHGQMYRFLVGTWEILEMRSSHNEKRMGIVSAEGVEMLEWVRPCR